MSAAVSDPEFDRRQREADHQAWIESARAVTTLDAASRMGWRPNRPGARGSQGAKGWLSGPCPVCGGTDRFAICLTGHKAGGFSCRKCALKGGDGIGLVMSAEGLSFLEAVERLAGPSPVGQTVWSAERRAAWREKQEAAARARAIAAAEAAQRAGSAARRITQICHRLLAEAAPWRGSPVETYLAFRGIDTALPIENLFYHPQVRYLTEDRRLIHCGPCMLARFQAPDGRLAAVQRTWIAEDPSAPGLHKGRPIIVDPETGAVMAPKKTLGSNGGAAIRLVRGIAWRDGVETGFPGDVLPPERLILGEGTETTLSVASALNRAGALLPRTALWSAGGLAVMAQVTPPPGAAHVVLLGDGDSEPESTAAALGRAEDAMLARGCTAATAWSARGQDFNTMLMRMRREARAA